MVAQTCIAPPACQQSPGRQTKARPRIASQTYCSDHACPENWAPAPAPHQSSVPMPATSASPPQTNHSHCAVCHAGAAACTVRARLAARTSNESEQRKRYGFMPLSIGHRIVRAIVYRLRASHALGTCARHARPALRRPGLSTYAGKGFRLYPPCTYCDGSLCWAGKFIHGWHIIARLPRHDGRQCDLKITTDRGIKLKADEQIAA